MKELRDILEGVESMENEELEHLEIKHKSALEDIAKKEEREKEFARVKSISNQVIQGMKEQIKKLEFEVNESNSVKEVSDNISKREIMEANLKYDLLKVEEVKYKESIVILENKVENLQLVNEENQILNQNIIEEKKVMKDKLDMMDKENDNSIPTIEAIEPLNLYAELGERKIDLVHEFECESCGKSYNKKETVEAHIRKCTEKTNFNQKVNELKRKLCDQRIKITS